MAITAVLVTLFSRVEIIFHYRFLNSLRAIGTTQNHAHGAAVLADIDVAHKAYLAHSSINVLEIFPLREALLQSTEVGSFSQVAETVIEHLFPSTSNYSNDGAIFLRKPITFLNSLLLESRITAVSLQTSSYVNSLSATIASLCADNCSNGTVPGPLSAGDKLSRYTYSAAGVRSYLLQYYYILGSFDYLND